MKFKRNQLVRVASGHPQAGRQGILLKSLRYRGRLWHVVKFEDRIEPMLLTTGTIECLPGVQFYSQLALIPTFVIAPLLPFRNKLPI